MDLLQYFLLDLFDIHIVLENTKIEYEKKLEKARAKQPKAEW